jgi:hypothetical protein
MARSLYAENKRVSNRKLKDELGVKLAFPTYRVGLEALWEAGKGGSAGFICTPRHPVQPTAVLRVSFLRIASEAVNARRSRQVAADPVNNVKIAHSGTAKRNGLPA